jgi:hypothetical protein
MVDDDAAAKLVQMCKGHSEEDGDFGWNFDSSQFLNVSGSLGYHKENDPDETPRNRLLLDSAVVAACICFGEPKRRGGLWPWNLVWKLRE